MANTTIIFTQDIMLRVNEFADAIDTSFYATRNQFDNKKRKRDQITGKLGEFAVYLFLKDKYPDLTEPDCNIYEKKNKTWDFDLKAKDINIHVKTQDYASSLKYSLSWTFQKNDKEIFKSNSDNQYVAFVSADIDKKFALVKSVLRLDTLHKCNMFKEPKLPQLRATKVVVYFSDIEPLEDKFCL